MTAPAPPAPAPAAPAPPLLLLGCGYTLTRLALSLPAGRRRVRAVTRDAGRRAALAAHGVELAEAEEALAGAAGAHVVVSVPPEAGRDAAWAQALSAHRPERLLYLSSTGVYGSAEGRVDESTPVDARSPAARGRLEAEALYRPLGGVALRVAGIYGPGRGLHQRLLAGTYRLPGGGTRRISRVHVDDLARAVLVALARAEAGTALCVADLAPVPQVEAVGWLCARLGVPLPPSIPLEEAPPTLRGDRAVASDALQSLGWQPRYPSYREGFAAVLEEEARGG
jgi:hypothetical protein